MREIYMLMLWRPGGNPAAVSLFESLDRAEQALYEYCTLQEVLKGGGGRLEEICKRESRQSAVRAYYERHPEERYELTRREVA